MAPLNTDSVEQIIRSVPGVVDPLEVLREVGGAELVAVTMQNMGLLPDKRPMSWYSRCAPGSAGWS